MHEVLSIDLWELWLGEVFPKHDFIIDFLDEEPLFRGLQYHKLLVEVLELVSELAAHIVGPLFNILVGLLSSGVNDELTGKRLPQDTHKNVHDSGLGQLLGTVIEPSTHLYKQTLLLLEIVFVLCEDLFIAGGQY